MAHSTSCCNSSHYDKQIKYWYSSFSLSCTEHGSGCKIFQKKNPLYFRQSIVQRNPTGFQDECVKSLVGCVVLTRYNNKTYRIDDIVWDKSPRHTFPCKNTGESMSFIDYYR